MKEKLLSNWGRGLMALTGILIVGGPGFVMADPPCPQYLIPRTAQVIGPSPVALNTNQIYKLKVFFTDGSNGLFTTEACVTWAVIQALPNTAAFSAVPKNQLMTGGTAKTVQVKGSYTNGGTTVNAIKVVKIQ